jgi:F0F1-type ATP synthase beta subunit
MLDIYDFSADAAAAFARTSSIEPIIELDDLPEQAFYMMGSIDEVRAKAAAASAEKS